MNESWSQSQSWTLDYSTCSLSGCLCCFISFPFLMFQKYLFMMFKTARMDGWTRWGLDLTYTCVSSSNVVSYYPAGSQSHETWVTFIRNHVYKSSKYFINNLCASSLQSYRVMWCVEGILIEYDPIVVIIRIIILHCTWCTVRVRVPVIFKWILRSSFFSNMFAHSAIRYGSVCRPCMFHEFQKVLLEFRIRTVQVGALSPQ